MLPREDFNEDCETCEGERTYLLACVGRVYISHINPFTSRTKTFPAPPARFTGVPPAVTTVPPAAFHCATAASKSRTTIVNAGDPGSAAPSVLLVRGTPLYSIRAKSAVIPGIDPCVI